MKQMIVASVYLEVVGYSHGDLHLSHYMLFRDGLIKLTDFRCVVNWSKRREARFPFGISMAPKVVENEFDNTELADVFDMGVCILNLFIYLFKTSHHFIFITEMKNKNIA